MYADPTRIRTHEIKIRLNDRELNLIKAIVEYEGGEPAVLAREMMLAQAQMQIKEQFKESQG